MKAVVSLTLRGLLDVIDSTFIFSTGDIETHSTECLFMTLWDYTRATEDRLMLQN